MIALFLLKLSAGITLMWLCMPRQDVTDGFFRIQMRLVLGTTVLTALLLSRTTTWALPPGGAESGKADHVAAWLRTLQVLAACCAYAGSIFWALGRRRPGRFVIWLLSLLCAGSVGVHSLQIPTRVGPELQLLSDAASSAVTGSVLTAMLLGHWYLTTPTMSIAPLRWFSRALVLAAAARLLATGIALVRFGSGSFAAVHADFVQMLWLISRIGGGILVPLVIAVLLWRILRYRNTQSATGVLFAGLILVFMGEMSAALLERATGVPF